MCVPIVIQYILDFRLVDAPARVTQEGCYSPDLPIMLGKALFVFVAE